MTDEQVIAFEEDLNAIEGTVRLFAALQDVDLTDDEYIGKDVNEGLLIGGYAALQDVRRCLKEHQ
jgi:hypothetical protein